MLQPLKKTKLEKRIKVPEKSAELEKRIAKIEAWIDLWETYDSGWVKYRKGKKK